MYTVNKDDKVIEHKDPPFMDTGSPSPQILAAEAQVIVTYRLNNPDLRSAEKAGDVDAYLAAKDRWALLTFSAVTAHHFGWPNEDVLNAHPLYARGLSHYGIFEVKHSSWIREIQTGNSVHPHHRSDWLADRRHFIITFHDSTFECIAQSYTFEVVHDPAESLRKSIAMEY